MTMLLLASCGKTIGTPDAKRKTPEIPCDAVFTPPAGAELLCNEHVLGKGMEIHWRSYGMAEQRHGVMDPYFDAARRCQLSFFFKPPLLSVSDGDGIGKGHIIEAFDASDATYPKCEKGPSPSHQTVIMISEKFDRP